MGACSQMMLAEIIEGRVTVNNLWQLLFLTETHDNDKDFTVYI